MKFIQTSISVKSTLVFRSKLYIVRVFFRNLQKKKTNMARIKAYYNCDAQHHPSGRTRSYEKIHSHPGESSKCPVCDKNNRPFKEVNILWHK